MSGACWVVDRGAELELRLSNLDADGFAAAVRTLKERLPAWGRRWDDGRRCWVIAASLADDLQTWGHDAGVLVHWLAEAG